MSNEGAVPPDYVDVDGLVRSIESTLDHSESVIFATASGSERNQVRRAVRHMGWVIAQPIKGGRMEVRRYRPPRAIKDLEREMWEQGLG